MLGILILVAFVWSAWGILLASGTNALNPLNFNRPCLKLILLWFILGPAVWLCLIIGAIAYFSFVYVVYPVSYQLRKFFHEN